ncbi:MAG: penicillin-binding protein activator LpoB [Desulfuromonadales bacterium]|uniref:penicillin-binding protein activator LpoB n=1 Tax=Desulfuromonas sp. KJ2020 TaxID=2919173 RepID=UPI0020A80AEA|nr:penicillin-binding protein activator LpoB [Desulfuromonas sp. KJ2020]
MRHFLIKSRFFLFLALLTAVGCSTTRHSFVEESFDPGYVQMVAVLPLENHSAEKFAAERLRDVVTTELLARRLFKVVEKGDLRRFLREEVAEAETVSLDASTAKRMGKALNVDAYLAGSVDDYSELRNGSYSYPQVALTLRLVDVQTGRIIWQASDSARGYSTFGRIFGFASPSVNEVSYRLVRDLLKSLR